MRALRFIGRLALLLVTFLGGLILACVAIGAALPFPEIPLVTAKIEFFRQHANEYDTLFLGSSRIYHQIIPSLFDQLTAERGLKTKSFNAAIDGMRPPELNYYIDQLLAAHPQHLRYIFIENGGVRVPLDPEKGVTIRDVYWHDFKRMCLIIRATAAQMHPPKKRLRQRLATLAEPLSEIADHAALFVRNFVNLGRAGAFMEPLLPHSEFDTHGPALGPNRDGYRNTGREEKILPQNLKVLEEGLAARQTKPFTIDYGDPESQRAFESLLATFEKRGVTTVQVIPPTTGSRKFHLKSEATSGRIVLDYSNLDKYPDLFDPKYRIDTDHLNHEGAQIFTRIVVEEFCARAQRQP